MKYLKANGVNAVFHYIPLHSSPAGEKYGRVSEEMKTTNKIAGKIVRLPIFFGMKKVDIEYVVATVREFYRWGM